MTSFDELFKKARNTRAYWASRIEMEPMTRWDWSALVVLALFVAACVVLTVEAIFLALAASTVHSLVRLVVLIGGRRFGGTDDTVCLVLLYLFIMFVSGTFAAMVGEELWATGTTDALWLSQWPGRGSR